MESLIRLSCFNVRSARTHGTISLNKDFFWETTLPQECNAERIKETQDDAERIVDRVDHMKPDIVSNDDPPLLLLEGMPAALSPIVSPEARVIDLKAITCNDVPETPTATITRMHPVGGSQSSATSSICLRPEPRPSKLALSSVSPPS